MKTTGNGVPSPLRRSARLAQARGSEDHLASSASSQANAEIPTGGNGELPTSPQGAAYISRRGFLRRSSRGNGALSSPSQVSALPTSSRADGGHPQSFQAVRGSLPQANRETSSSSQAYVITRRSSRASAGLPTESSTFLASEPQNSSRDTVTTQSSRANAELPSTTESSTSQDNVMTRSSRASAGLPSSELSSFQASQPPSSSLATRRSLRCAGLLSQANFELPTLSSEHFILRPTFAIASPSPTSAPMSMSTPMDHPLSRPESGALQSSLAALLNAEPSPPVAPVAGTSKEVDEKIVLVPLKDSGSLCSTDSSSVDGTDNSAAAEADTTDSSISSSLFAWSVGSNESGEDTTHAHSIDGRSSSISVITDPEEGGSEEEEIEEEEDLLGDEDDDLTTDTSHNSFDVLDPQDEEPEDKYDGDNDSRSSSWTDVTGDSDYKEEELMKDDFEEKPNDNTKMTDDGMWTDATDDSEYKDEELNDFDRKPEYKSKMKYDRTDVTDDSEYLEKELNDFDGKPEDQSEMEDNGRDVSKPSTSFKSQISSNNGSTNGQGEVSNLLVSDQVRISDERRISAMSNVDTCLADRLKNIDLDGKEQTGSETASLFAVEELH